MKKQLLFIFALFFVTVVSAQNGTRPQPANPFDDAILQPSGITSQESVAKTMSPGDAFSGTTIQNGGDRIVAMQYTDGGWGWPLTSPPTYGNIHGPIAKGLAQAFNYTQSLTQHTALSNAGAFLLLKTNNFSPSDGYLALALDNIFGGNTYRNHLNTNFYGPLAAGTYNRKGEGVLYNTSAYILKIRNDRASVAHQANMAAWDLGMGLVGAASCGVTGAELNFWIEGTKAEINELDALEYYDVIGLAGGLYGLAFVDEEFDPTAGAHVAASNLNDLAVILASYQIALGGFAWNSAYVIPGDNNETTQETAYSILALNEVNRTVFFTNIIGAADYLSSTQLTNGGWMDWAVGEEYNEITSEALWGYSVAYPTITVITPATNITWYKGFNHPITWSQSFDGDAHITLFQGGLLKKVINDAVPAVDGSNSYSWTIPADLAPGSYDLYVEKDNWWNATPPTQILGHHAFNIEEPSIAVLTPVANITWQRGTQQTITWTKNFSGPVHIDWYSSDESIYYGIIADMVPEGTNSYSWTIPVGTVAGNYHLKVWKDVDYSVNGVSSFNVGDGSPYVTVLSPNGGEQYLRGGVCNIAWDDNLTSNVKIDLYTADQNTLVQSISTAATGNAFAWTVPATLAPGTYKIRIANVNNPNVTYDFSNNSFSVLLSIPGSAVILNTPAPGTSYPRNTTLHIGWTKTIFTENVQLELFNPITGAYELLAWSLGGTFMDWWIPSYMTPNTNYRIKVTSVVNSSITDEHQFAITASAGGTVNITSPTAGATLLRNTTHTITWNDTFTENVKIEIAEPGGPYAILTNSVSGNSWSWWIPHYTTPASGYKIRISSVLDSQYNNEVTFNIAISAAGSTVTLTTPGTATSYPRNSSLPIAWTKTFSENVKVELYNPFTFNYDLLAWSTGGLNMNWWIPSYMEPSPNYRIRVSSTLDPSVDDEHTFAITASAGGDVFLSTPTGGLTLIRNTSYAISFTKTFTENVKLEIAEPGGSYVTLTNSISSFSWDWWIPYYTLPGNGYKIRASSVLDPSLNDEVTFNIAISAPGGTVTITSPVVTDVWLRNSTHPITWTKSITEDVRLELWNPTTSTWEYLAWSVGGGSWSWWIPNYMAPSAGYKIKVSSVLVPATYDEVAFSIAVSAGGGTVTVTSPTTGANWLVSSTHAITWDKTFTEDVRLELWDPTVSAWQSLAWSVSGETWDWWIPFYVTPAIGYKIKATSVVNSSLSSEVSFNIVASFGSVVTVVSPNGGEWWGVNTTHPITWTDDFAENVKIELKKPDLTYETLTNGAGGNSWSWWIPNYTPEGLYRIRISNILNPGITDESNADFHINIFDLLTYPNPVISTVTLESDIFNDPNCTVELYNHYGIRLLTRSVSMQSSKQYSLSLDNLPNNVYYIVVTSDYRRVSGSIIIQH